MAARKTVSNATLALRLGALLIFGAEGCANTLAFSDTAAIVVVGHPPPPPAPPPPPPPPPVAEPAPPKRVEVQQDQIVIREKIQFETDKATIKPDSFDLLNEIVQVTNDNPQIKKLSIEGHTDAEGSDKHNLKLSDKRAAAVRAYLTEHGVTAARLVSKGWGETKPIADNESDAGREQNRRVEFVIVEQDLIRRTYEIDPKTGEKRDVTGKNELAPTPSTTESQP